MDICVFANADRIEIVFVDVADDPDGTVLVKSSTSTVPTGTGRDNPVTNDAARNIESGATTNK